MFYTLHWVPISVAQIVYEEGYERVKDSLWYPGLHSFLTRSRYYLLALLLH